MTSVRGPRPDGRRGHGRDQGSALMIVLVMMTVLALFASVGLTFAINTLGVVDRSEDNKQALAAAEAGVADYLARLNQADDYWKKVDCANPAMKGPRAETNTCGWNASTAPGFATVPGAARSTYHYDVSTAVTTNRGSILLTSTGKTGRTTRTVQVTLRRGGLAEYLYYTEYETIDPANEVVYSSVTNAARECNRHWYDQPSRPVRDDDRRTGCPDINFTSGDVIRGPLHTNDAFLVNGNPTFQGTVTTSLPSCQSNNGNPAACYRRTSSSDRPTFARGIGYLKPFDLPNTIGTLRQYVDPAQSQSASSALGCLYTGPTRVKFLPTAVGATPQMRVWSRWTTAAQLNPGCGTTTALTSAEGALLTVPKDNLIYVQDVPATQSSPRSDDCKTTGRIGDGFPLMSDSDRGVFEFSMTLRDSDCRFGNAYVEGQLRGRVSVATDNNIIVTGDLTYAGGASGTDALGLMAKNSVQVYHPMKLNCQYFLFFSCSNYSLSEMNRPNGTKFRDPTIHAAIQALQHSFTVQRYDLGSDLGKLTVLGSIAQLYRGPVGKGTASQVSTGYLKDYTWDSRLKYSPPPYFLEPRQSFWGQKTFAEIQAQYRP